MTDELRRRSARDAVMRRIAEQVRRFPDLDLTPLDTSDLDERDARLAQAIYVETIRRWLTLEHLLNTRLKQPIEQLEAKMRAALLVGGCQIFFFDHLPDHAVVDETAKWAARRVRPRAGGLANAVLRRMIELRGEVVDRSGSPEGSLPLSDGRQLQLTAPVLPEDRTERLAVRTSHPVELIRRWSKRMSPAEVERLALHNLIQPPIIVAGLTSDTIAESENLQPHDEPGFAVWSGDHAGLVSLLAQHPGARVQDPSSAAAVAAIADIEPRPQFIVDLCAGGGTKTEQLAQTFPDARIIATDIDQRRYDLLTERFANDERVEVIDHRTHHEFAGQADLILVDVPCSNTGTLARRIEAKYRVDPAHLNSLVEVQRQIIIDALRLRAPDGRILYSTCSLEPEENTKQVAWVRRWHNLRSLHESRRLPMGAPGDPPSHYSDGAFCALLG